MKPEEQARKLNKIIAKAWMDDRFKERLLADPSAILQEEGVEIPPGIEVRVAADTDKVRYLTLPVRPLAQELSDEQLTRITTDLCLTASSPTWRQCHWCDH